MSVYKEYVDLSIWETKGFFLGKSSAFDFDANHKFTMVSVHWSII